MIRIFTTFDGLLLIAGFTALVALSMVQACRSAI